MAYRIQTLTFTAVACLMAAPLAADVKRGVDAWSAGDFDSAVNEWRLPAEEGDADALFNMAQAYRLGRGVTADIARARELYAKAAEKGHVKAADNYGLLLFQQGEQKSAMPLIRAAAERGDPRAQYVLGLAHFNADYAERNWERAYALLTLAQAQGLPQATNALAQMDKYIPLAQRQKAQTLAGQLQTEAAQRRAAQLAAADLARSNTSPVPVATASPAPVRVAQASAKTPAAVQPVSSYSGQPQRVPASIRPAPAKKSGGSPKAGAWGVQLGAFGQASNADRLWSKLVSNPALQGTKKTLVPGGGVTRLRAVGFSSKTAASRACSQLKAQGQACMVSKPKA